MSILTLMSGADRCGINAIKRDPRQDTRPGSGTHGQMQYKHQQGTKYNPRRVSAKIQDTPCDSKQQKIES